MLPVVLECVHMYIYCLKVNMASRFPNFSAWCKRWINPCLMTFAGTMFSHSGYLIVLMRISCCRRRTTFLEPFYLPICHRSWRRRRATMYLQSVRRTSPPMRRAILVNWPSFNSLFNCCACCGRRAGQSRRTRFVNDLVAFKKCIIQ